MSEDIVVQLRWISDAKEWVKLRLWEAITTEAADEIERLRADLEEMRQVVISEHRRWCDRPCNAEGWNLHE